MSTTAGSPKPLVDSNVDSPPSAHSTKATLILALSSAARK